MPTGSTATCAGAGDDADAIEALGDFKRFPTWMWRNADVLDFVGWLRAHNDALGAAEAQVGFYGLDLYSLHASIEAVLGYLDKVDPAAAARARASATAASSISARTRRPTATRPASTCAPSCEDEVVAQLVELQRRAAELRKPRRARWPRTSYFYAEQNARLVKNAEQYYRIMFRGRIVLEPARHAHGRDARRAARHTSTRSVRTRRKVVVWAHNSHLGDAARHRDGRQGELNVGQLVRERHATSALLVGFSTYNGTVTAASTGTRRPSASGCARRCRTATRRCSTAPVCPACCSTCGGNSPAVELVSPAAPAARDRRDLPPGDRAPEPLFPRAAGRAVRLRRAPRSDPRPRAAGDRASPPAEVPETFPTGM